MDREADCFSSIETIEFPGRLAVALREIKESKMAGMTPRDLV